MSSPIYFLQIIVFFVLNLEFYWKLREVTVFCHNFVSLNITRYAHSSGELDSFNASCLALTAVAICQN